MEAPVDNGLVGTRVMKINTIPLTILLDETFELHHNINRSHLNLQILQIITPNNGRNTAIMKPLLISIRQREFFYIVNTN